MESDNTHFIIEYHHVGNSIRVTAMDPLTLTEVVIVGSPKSTKKQLSDLAVKKLRYILAKDKI
jgi:hypothetical protein